jgi:DNA-binding transcriptional LysR family regulator
VKLFVRTTRSLALSPEGRDLHERALRLLQEAEALEQSALSARSVPSGLLRVTAAVPIGTHVLGPALPRFHERYPEVRVDLRLTDHLLDLVNERIDVAIRVGQLHDSQLGSRRFGPHRVGAFASPAYLAAHGRPKTPQDLSRHRCVAVRFQSTGQTLRWPFQVGGRVVELVPDAWLTVDSTEANVAVLCAGGGISIIPNYVAAPYVAAGKLVPVLAAHAVERFAFTALWPASRRSNPAVGAFLAFLDEVLPVPAPWDRLRPARRPRSLRLE